MKLKPSHAAATEGRTIHTKYRRGVTPECTVLKPVSANSKVGKDSTVITKGRWAGMPMFSLTLEERATCPRSCIHWLTCYGSNMPFAHRFEHGPALEKKLTEELDSLARIYRHGFVIRLHILGDFYSTDYVKFWRDILARLPMLRVFGYSAREGSIGAEILATRSAHPDRWWVRFSRNQQPDLETGAIYAGMPDETAGIPCPEQTGKTSSCTTCGLCWTMTQTVTFATH